MRPSVLLSVSIHISHLIGQMRGTSHEFETPRVRCVQGTDQREANQLNIITVEQKQKSVALSTTEAEYIAAVWPVGKQFGCESSSVSRLGMC